MNEPLIHSRDRPLSHGMPSTASAGGGDGGEGGNGEAAALVFHGDVYAISLGRGEALFLEGEEEEEEEFHFSSSPVYRQSSHAYGATAHSPTPSRHNPTLSPYPSLQQQHAGAATSDAPSSPTSAPSSSYTSRFLTGSFFFPSPTEEQKERRKRAAVMVDMEVKGFRHQARFTTSRGVPHTADGKPVPHELWRFRRRGFQDCWMAVFFVFTLLIALCTCYAEIRALSLTPAMRQRMEERWGMCEVDFAALHVRNNVQSFLDSVGGGGEDGSTSRVARRRNHTVNVPESTTGVSEWEEFTAIHWIHQKEAGLTTASPNAAAASRKPSPPQTKSNSGEVNHFSREEDRMYRKIGKTVTFRSLEALIVGLDYTLCNRIQIEKSEDGGRSNKGQDEEEEPIILTDPELDATLDLPSRNVTPELYWDEYPDDETHSAFTGTGRTKNGGEGSSVRRRRHPIQSILDEHPQTWPLYAMEWQPLIMFEVALCVAILLSLLSVLALSRLHEMVLPVLLTLVVLVSAVSSITVLYLYSNLFVAVAFAIVGVGISWWWWVYGAPRKALAGVLLRFAGDLFVEKNNSYDPPVVTPSSPNSPQRVLPNYRRFFIFSLTASAVHILDLTIVMLALMPPFFRFVSGEGLSFGDILYVLLILVSDYWLLSVVNVVLEYVASGVTLTLYYNGCNRRPPATPLKDFLTAACTTHFGAICAHAFCLAPVEMVYQIFSFFSPPHDEEESQTSVFGRAAGAVRTWLEQKVCCHVNAFALMHVVMYGCSYDDAAKHTWAMMREEGRVVCAVPHTTHAAHDNQSQPPISGHAVSPGAVVSRRPPFSKVLHHHLKSSTMDVSVGMISWASSLVVALATWGSLHVYLQRLHPSTTSTDPVVADFFFDGKDLSKIDWSSIAIALVVLFSVYHIHGHYTVVYRTVWRTLCLCSVECPSGLPCTFPLLFHDICKAIRSSRIRVLMATLEREQEGRQNSDSFLVEFAEEDQPNALLEKASAQWAKVNQ